MQYWKAIGALPLSLLLMGSKIIITVPAGGTVVSSSGLFACSAGQVCTIDVSDPYFGDTFTAAPKPGNAFSHWENSAGSICSGSNPECADAGSNEFSGYSQGEGVFASGATMTMRPAFVSGGSDRAVEESRFTVSSRQLARFYRISGDSLDELWKQLDGPANPLPVRGQAGRKPFAHSDLSYHYSYQPGYGASASQCRVESANISFEFATTLPGLNNLEEKPDRIRTQWLAFQGVLIDHEASHQKIYRQLVDDIPRALDGLGSVPCNELDNRVRVAVNTAVNSAKKASADIDLHEGDNYAASAFQSQYGMLD